MQLAYWPRWASWCWNFILDHEVRVDRRHAATMRERKRLRKVSWEEASRWKFLYVEFPGERSFWDPSATHKQFTESEASQGLIHLSALRKYMKFTFRIDRDLCFFVLKSQTNLEFVIIFHLLLLKSKNLFWSDPGWDLAKCNLLHWVSWGASLWQWAGRGRREQVPPALADFILC